MRNCYTVTSTEFDTNQRNYFRLPGGHSIQFVNAECDMWTVNHREAIHTFMANVPFRVSFAGEVGEFLKQSAAMATKNITDSYAHTKESAVPRRAMVEDLNDRPATVTSTEFDTNQRNYFRLPGGHSIQFVNAECDMWTVNHREAIHTFMANVPFRVSFAGEVGEFLKQSAAMATKNITDSYAHTKESAVPRRAMVEDLNGWCESIHQYVQRLMNRDAAASSGVTLGEGFIDVNFSNVPVAYKRAADGFWLRVLTRQIAPSPLFVINRTASCREVECAILRNRESFPSS